jgi:hypothetical protein
MAELALPLAESLAQLADDSRSALQALQQFGLQLQSQTTEQAALLERSTEHVSAALKSALKKLETARSDLSKTQAAHAQNLRSANSLIWLHLGSGMATGLLSAVLLIGFWTWRHPSPPPSVTLDAKAVAALIKENLSCTTPPPKR